MITFSVPVVVNGNLNLSLAGVTLVSQVVTSPTVLTQTYSAAVVGKAWTITAGDPSIATFQGGSVAGSSGNF